MVHTIAPVSLILCAFTASPPAAGDPDRGSLTREPLELSGLEEQIRPIPAHVLTSLQQKQGSLLARQWKILSRIVKDTVKEENLRIAVAEALVDMEKE